MDLVRSNFKLHKEELLNDIGECDFIAIDGEFTGISNDNHRTMPFDTVAERYDKLRQGNMNYLMCQVGLVMFFHKADGSYKAKPYNFYVLPQQFFSHSRAQSPEFVCQAACIQFLAGHGFDFNKVFLEGIPYLRPAEESRIKDKLTEQEEERRSSGTGSSATPLTIKGDDQKFINDVIKQVNQYLADPNVDEAEPLKLAPCSAWRRKMTYHTLESKYSDSLHLQSAGDDKVKYITVAKVDKEQKRAREEAAFAQKLEKLSDAAGFTSVIKEISRAGKLIIGHNMLLDIMYVVSQFLSELPEAYEDFKAMVSEFFPRILDTKLMSSTSVFKDDIPYNSLEELCKVLESPLYKQLRIEIPDGFPDYTQADSDKVKYHDAAYDAFATGKCFALMAQHVGAKAKPPIHNLASNTKLLAPFLNKIFLFKMEGVPYMNIGGPEVVPDRDHVYHLTFPKMFTKDDINKIFYPSLIYITWIDSQSATVTLQQRGDNSVVKKMLKNKPRNNDVVIKSFQDWVEEKKGLSANQTPHSAAKKRKPESSSDGCSAKSSKVEPITKADTEPGNADSTLAMTSSSDSREEKREKLFEESTW